MPRRKVYNLAHYSKSGVVTESRKSAEVDQIWGDRQPFHGDDKPWDVRVDTVLTECVPLTAPPFSPGAQLTLLSDETGPRSTLRTGSSRSASCACSLSSLKSKQLLTKLRNRCSNGCAVDVAVKDGQVVGMKGRAVDRINKGRLGPKGCVLARCVHTPSRSLTVSSRRMYGWVSMKAEDRLKTPVRSRFPPLPAYLCS